MGTATTKPRVSRRVSYPTIPRGPVVYAHLDTRNRPLYVGQTITFAARLGQHVHASPWMDKAKRITWWCAPDESRLNECEAIAIARLTPKHNVMRNWDKTDGYDEAWMAHHEWGIAKNAKDRYDREWFQSQVDHWIWQVATGNPPPDRTFNL